MRKWRGPSRKQSPPLKELRISPGLSFCLIIPTCFVSDLKSFLSRVIWRSLIRPVNSPETKAPAFYFVCFPLHLTETRIVLSTWWSLNRSCWLYDLGNLVNRLVKSPSLSCVTWHSLVAVPDWLTSWRRQQKEAQRLSMPRAVQSGKPSHEQMVVGEVAKWGGSVISFNRLNYPYSMCPYYLLWNRVWQKIAC